MKGRAPASPECHCSEPSSDDPRLYWERKIWVQVLPWKSFGCTRCYWEVKQTQWGLNSLLNWALAFPQNGPTEMVFFLSFSFFFLSFSFLFPSKMRSISNIWLFHAYQDICGLGGRTTKGFHATPQSPPTLIYLRCGLRAKSMLRQRKVDFFFFLMDPLQCFDPEWSQQLWEHRSQPAAHSHRGKVSQGSASPAHGCSKFFIHPGPCYSSSFQGELLMKVS